MSLSEIPVNKSLRWPNGARLACLVTFDYQGEVGLPTEYRGVRPDLKIVKEHIYEPRVGIWRILETLDRYEVPATFPTCGRSVELYPKSCHEILERGHELAAHGYEHEMLNQLPLSGEEAAIDQTLAAFQVTLGMKPAGWRSPYYLVTEDTTRLLIERGFEWQSDFHDDDLPYTLTDGSKSIVEIPPQIDDWPRYWSDVGVYPQAVRGNPRDILSTIVDAFDVLYREAESATKLFCITLHPQIVGRPDRLIILEGFLQHARSRADVWWGRCADVAQIVREGTGAHATVAPNTSSTSGPSSP